MKKPWIQSLSTRLTLSIGAVMMMLLLGFGGFVEYSVRRHFLQQDAAVLQLAMQNLQKSLQAGNLPCQNSLSYNDLYIHISDAEGRTILTTEGLDFPTFSQTLLMPTASFDNALIQHWKNGDQDYRVMTVFIEAQGQSYLVAIALNIRFHNHYMHDLRLSLWITILVATFTVVLTIRFVIYQGHAPLRALSRKINNISSSHLQTRLDTSCVPTELKELVDSFNTMIERIEDTFRRQANFSADIAHEMRTPVMNLITQTQVALNQARSMEEYREILYSNLEEYERMGKMISDMLFLAQADEHQLTPECVPVDLSAELETLFEYFDAWAEEHGVQLEQQGAAGKVQGDRAMLRRAISNLMSNAIRHTPAGETVCVRLRQEAEQVLIEVENVGDPVPAEHLPHLFDRFYRIDASRQRNEDGAGIGLAIVKSIAEAHGGSVNVHSNPQRTCFCIRLPNGSLSNNAIS